MLLSQLHGAQAQIRDLELQLAQQALTLQRRLDVSAHAVRSPPSSFHVALSRPRLPGRRLAGLSARPCQ